MSRHAPTRTKIQLRKGDQVKVMAGPDAGRSGRVLSVNPLKNTVIVEHANIVKRHTRANPNKNVKGGIIEKEAPLWASKVMPLDPKTKNIIGWERARRTMDMDQKFLWLGLQKPVTP